MNAKEEELVGYLTVKVKERWIGFGIGVDVGFGVSIDFEIVVTFWRGTVITDGAANDIG
jgi:hypothetical protein